MKLISVSLANIKSNLNNIVKMKTGIQFMKYCNVKKSQFSRILDFYKYSVLTKKSAPYGNFCIEIIYDKFSYGDRLSACLKDKKCDR